jgi:Ca-activated chloride channel family protein
VSAAQGASLRRRVSLAVVLDVSGSMQGEKLLQAKQAARALVARLDDDDELALVAFSDAAKRFELRRMSESSRVAAGAFIDGLVAAGATNVGAGLSVGDALLGDASGQRRLVLVSDGKPTVGLAEAEPLAHLAAASRERGITVTAIGVGEGFDASLMHELAQAGGGLYGDLRTPGALEVVLADELRQARAAVARDVVLALRPGAGVQVVGVAGRRVVASGDGPRVRLPDFGPGQTARVFVKLRHAGGRDEGPGGQALLAPALAWTDTADVRAEVEARLLVPFSHDESAIEATRDEALFADVARAFGNEQLVLAAVAMEQGDRARALSLLDQARNVFSASSVALSSESVDLQRRASAWTRDGYDAHNESKDAMRKSLKTFGVSNYAAY